MKNRAIALCQHFIETNSNPPNILNIGCGDGSLDVQLARMGASVTACDIEDSLGAAAREACDAKLIRVLFRPAQLMSMPKKIDIGILLKVLHWLPFKEARGVVRRVAERMPPNAPLLVSIAGLDSDLGINYPFNERVPIEARHAKTINTRGVSGHPVTLYTGAEAQDLISRNGFNIRSASMTNMGIFNIAAVRYG